MAQAALRQIVFSLAATGLLIGCVEGTSTGVDGGSAPAMAASGKKGAAHDVEAPEVFQVTDSALWDGRPSLGGIWVASPDVTDPERVVMFNPATGKSVTGALFRRERENPGPTLQISSDAAEALGILAGQPAEIRVTALRREEPESPAEPAVLPPSDTAGAGAEDSAAADAAATAAAATAALAATGASGQTADPAAAADPVALPDGAALEAPPKRKTWKERRAEAKAAREAKKAAAAAAAAEMAGSDSTDTVESAGVEAIETVPLDARAAEATEAAGAAAGSESPEARREKEAAAEAEVEAGVEPAPTATGRPIQIASFSKEENANRAVQAVAKIGVTAQAQKSENNGKTIWGVVAFGDAAMLASIKAAGFSDAYFLK